MDPNARRRQAGSATDDVLFGITAHEERAKTKEHQGEMDELQTGRTI